MLQSEEEVVKHALENGLYIQDEEDEEDDVDEEDSEQEDEEDEDEEEDGDSEDDAPLSSLKKTTEAATVVTKGRDVVNWGPYPSDWLWPDVQAHMR